MSWSRGLAASQGKANQEQSTLTGQAGAATSPLGTTGKSRSGSGPQMVFRVRHSPVMTQHGHHDKAGPSLCQEAQLVGLESRSRLKSYKPKRRLAATQLWCSPSRGRWHTPSLKAVLKGKTGQGIASGFLTAALTGTEANLGLRQVDSLTQPTKLPKGGCAPGPVN